VFRSLITHPQEAVQNDLLHNRSPSLLSARTIMPLPTSFTRELAAPTRWAWPGYLTPSPTAYHILYSGALSSPGIRNLYDLYQEMEDKDGHLYSVLQTRKNGVLSRERKVVAASDAPRDREVADFIERALHRIPQFDQALRVILDALGKGVSVTEILWAMDAGRVVIAALKSRFQGRFLFDLEGKLCLQNDANTARGSWNAAGPSGLLTVTGESLVLQPQVGRLLPPEKFIVFTFDARHGNPYGNGLCQKAYWYYWFKKNNLKFWVIFNEKFGSPTVVGKYRAGTSDDERDRLLEVIDGLQNDTGIVVPETMVIELLEARRSGNVNTYRDLADWCNDEISKIVLGGTLTSGEGRRSGSYALGKVHEAVRNEYVASDACALMDVVNSQLVARLVEYNFGRSVAAPRWTLDISDDEDLLREAQLDSQLVGMGVPLPLAYFYERYKRPAPLTDQRSLRYDDNNLYQYHLEFGVLTINEIRRSLGLEPVPWGNDRPEPMQRRRAGVRSRRRNSRPENPAERGDDPDEEKATEESAR
jgi:phage gp29-like protein